MRPLISIGIPAYDQWSTLRRLLQSLRSQRTSVIYEIIVGDDHHPEDLASRVKREFPDIISFRNPENHGPAYTRNRIIEKARAPYLAFFDADCVIPAGWLEAVKPALAQDRILSGKVVRPDGSLEWGPRRRTWLGVSVSCDVSEADVASSNNMVIPVQRAKELGGFNEGLGIYFEDSLFSLEFCRSGGHVVYLKEAVVEHHHHSLLKPARLKSQARNTLWSMHHVYAGRPAMRWACYLGLVASYGLKAAVELLSGRPGFARAWLLGVGEGTRFILTREWRGCWLDTSNAERRPRESTHPGRFVTRRDDAG